MNLPADVLIGGACNPTVQEAWLLRAKLKEMQGWERMQAVQVVNQPKGCRPIGTRWVVTGTGESTKARLVATEVAHFSADASMFASTPSTASFRTFLAASSVRMARDPRIVLASIDISKAFLHASIQEGREVYLRAPREADLAPGTCWKARKAVYGLRHSPADWSRHLRAIMLAAGFRQSRLDPCLFVHPVTGVSVLSYVDDLLFCGDLDSVQKIIEILRKQLDASDPHYLCNPGDKLCMLGRTIIRTLYGLIIQTDAKHCAAVVEEMDAASRRKSEYPGRKLTSIEREMLGGVLDSRRAATYRSCTGKLIYASSDRPELAFVVKSLAGGMSAPRESDWLQLDACARYLRDRESVIISLEPDFTSTGGEIGKTLFAFSDADWAGDSGSRKSTSGGYLSWNGVSLGHWSRSQSTIALSSCESEFYGCISAVSEGLFSLGLLLELGFETRLRLMCDSSAALGLLQKPGVSRPLRHLDCKYLFLQQLLYERRLDAAKVAGTLNGADILTKYPTKDMLSRHLPSHRVSFVPLQEAMGSAAKVTKIVRKSS
jgi:hypothetical protein